MFRHARFIIPGVLLVLLSAGPAPAPIYHTSWIGNTFGGADDKWVQNNISALFVTPDGACYTDSFWDEAGHEAGIYKNGSVVGGCDDAHGHGGFAVTADAHFLYIAYKLKDHVCGVRRYDLTGKPAPFPGGGHDGSFLEMTASPGAIRGLALSGNELFISDYDANLVRVYTAATMAPIRTFPIDRPMRLAAGSDGNLWIIQSKTAAAAAKIICVKPDGRLLKPTIANVENPVALATDASGRLLVADDGPDQQVRIYDHLDTEPHLTGTIGEKGGIFAGTRGLVGPLRFNGLTGVGVDARGNIYISHNGLGPFFADHPGFGAELKCFTQHENSWTLRWQLQGLEFVAMADADPASEMDIFTPTQYFVMDYSKGLGQEWTYRGCTVDRLAYPDDPRLHAISECVLGVRHLQGKRFLYLTNMYASFVSIYRWDEPNERFIPSGIIAREPFKANDFVWPPFQPRQGDWIWRDANGDGHFDAAEYERHEGDNPFVWGWCVDSRGTIWKAERENGLRRFPMQGLDAHGNPIYSYATSDVVPNPAPFEDNRIYRGDINRIEYDAAGDVMYLAGYTAQHPNKPSMWGQVGPAICRYDNWSKGNRRPKWEINPPYDASGQPQILDKAMSVAGDYLFVTYMQQPRVLVYDARTAALVATLTPDPEVGGKHVGWVDVPYGIKAFARANGEYLVFNEEDWRGKILMYRWTPGNGP